MSGFPMPKSERVWEVGTQVTHVVFHWAGTILEVVPGTQRGHPWADFLALVDWDDGHEPTWQPMQHLWETEETR